MKNKIKKIKNKKSINKKNKKENNKSINKEENKNINKKENNKSINKEENKNINKKENNKNINKEENKNINKENNNKSIFLNKKKDIYEMSGGKIEKNIIKNVLKGGFCSKYKGDSCNKISIKMDPIAPINAFLNFILDIVQNSVLKFLTDGFNFVIQQWNEGITSLSTTIERFILLVIFTINGYTNTFNYMLDDIRLMLRILVVILTNGNPLVLITIYIMPIMNELLSFVMDSGTIDIITSLFTFEFKPIVNFIKAFLHLLIGKTVKGKCNLEDYGNNKKYMDSECYEFSVPKCKLNIRTLYYITMVIIILIYISAWISFLKLFYPD